MSACHAMPLDAGLIRDILGSVDCNVQAYSAAGYLALTGPGSPLPAALTTMLTIYVVMLGYRMMFAVGSTRLSDTPLIAMKIGVILAVTLNWSVFQTLVFNFDTNAPLEIGRLISHPMAGGGARGGGDCAGSSNCCRCAGCSNDEQARLARRHRHGAAGGDCNQLARRSGCMGGRSGRCRTIAESG